MYRDFDINFGFRFKSYAALAASSMGVYNNFHQPLRDKKDMNPND